MTTKSPTNLHSPPVRKRFLVTIDDSPDSGTSRLLDILGDLDIRVILFCIGAQIEENPELSVKAIRKGHVIGNHSYAHSPYSTLTTAQITDDILRAEAVIDGCYATAGVPRRQRYFRCPFGDKGNGRSRLAVASRRFFERYRHTQHTLRQLGFSPPPKEAYSRGMPMRLCRTDIDWSWTLDPKEFTNAPWPETARILHDALARPGTELLLLHDHEISLTRLRDVLRMLKETNAEFLEPESPAREALT